MSKHEDVEGMAGQPIQVMRSEVSDQILDWNDPAGANPPFTFKMRIREK